MKVKQHIPSFVSGITPLRTEVSSLEELLALPWVEQWTGEDGFDHWAQSPYGEHILLMAIMKDKHWVVAYLDTSEPINLPIWSSK